MSITGSGGNLVNWGIVGRGMVMYSNCEAVVTPLTWAQNERRRVLSDSIFSNKVSSISSRSFVQSRGSDRLSNKSDNWNH
jgi:hypothetical protein